MRNFVNEMILSDHRPADYYVDAAIDYFGIEGENGFVRKWFRGDL